MNAPRPISRQRSRAAALQILYAIDLNKRLVSGEECSVFAVQIFEEATSYIEVPLGAHEHARKLIIGVTKHLDELDNWIVSQVRNWRIDRMAVVDRNVLRLATFEITYDGIPVPVAIDEAVQLAKRYGAERSPEFVNGILDALARCWIEGRR